MLALFREHASWIIEHALDEIINIQPKGDNAKPYQVKQVRAAVLRYGLKIEE